MRLQHFDNVTGEGIIGFDPWRTSGPEYEADHNLWYAALTVNGRRVFQYGCPCGTCGITFKKVASAVDRVSDAEAAGLLGALDHVPSESALRRLARILPKGAYHLAVIGAPVRLVIPGAPDDYFATDVVRLFGLEPPEYEKPEDPGTPYYRLGSHHELAVPYPGGEIPVIRYSYPTRVTKTLLTQIVMPLQNPATLERDRVEYWKSRSRAGHPLTAFAVSVLDSQSPEVWKGDKDYPYEGQMLLTHCILDGHHRVQAASETGSPVRILSLLAPFASNVREDFDYELVLDRLAVQVALLN
ncbi:MAG: hypothetical protein ACREQR_13020 [Candidatus Binataceae bacterium]